MAVGASMDIMAYRAALNTGCFVFIQKGAGFFGMALKTCLMLKSCQPFSYRWPVGIMTGNTIQNAFSQAVPFI